MPDPDQFIADMAECRRKIVSADTDRHATLAFFDGMERGVAEVVLELSLIRQLLQSRTTDA